MQFFLLSISSIIVSLCHAQAPDPFQVTELTDPLEFKRLIDEGRFTAVIDVRSRSEWDNEGHIPNATLVASLNSGVTTPSDLSGCEYCDLALYCAGGVRARGAITKLQEAGFKGRLFNGQGVSQWRNAGLPLVNTPSVPAACVEDSQVSQDCELAYLARTGGIQDTEVPTMVPVTLEPTVSPTLAPTSAPTESPSERPTLSPTVVPTQIPMLTETEVPTETPVATTTSIEPTTAPIKTSMPPKAAPTTSPVTTSWDPTASPVATTTSPATDSPSTAQPTFSDQVVLLNSVEFKNLKDEGRFTAVLDVRRQEEWDAGHIHNATLVESLGSFGTASQVSTPDDLMGCEYCHIAVYCRTGRRSKLAIGVLIDAGFQGTLYDGLGITQWTGAGFELVNGTSVPAPCTESEEVRDSCVAAHTGTLDPTAEPSTRSAALWLCYWTFVPILIAYLLQ